MPGRKILHEQTKLKNENGDNGKICVFRLSISFVLLLHMIFNLNILILNYIRDIDTKYSMDQKDLLYSRNYHHK